MCQGICMKTSSETSPSDDDLHYLGSTSVDKKSAVPKSDTKTSKSKAKDHAETHGTGTPMWMIPYKCFTVAPARCTLSVFLHMTSTNSSEYNSYSPILIISDILCFGCNILSPCSWLILESAASAAAVNAADRSIISLTHLWYIFHSVEENTHRGT